MQIVTASMYKVSKHYWMQICAGRKIPLAKISLYTSKQNQNEITRRKLSLTIKTMLN